MSDVLNELSKSSDPLERDLASALRAYQNIRAQKNLVRSVGYEPKDIRIHGAVKLIEGRVRSRASGFDTVPVEKSYEAIVLKYADRFDPEVVALARERTSHEDSVLAPTPDQAELDAKVDILMQRSYLPFPAGSMTPKTYEGQTKQFFRDPQVKAYVLRQARGKCQACQIQAPFKTARGHDFLEVHHLLPLAQGGTDRVQNCVALCPNCHRALHHAGDAQERVQRLYARYSHLIPEAIARTSDT